MTLALLPMLATLAFGGPVGGNMTEAVLFYAEKNELRVKPSSLGNKNTQQDESPAQDLNRGESFT